VIAVLLAPARVAARGLQMAAPVHADPHVGVRGRNRQRVDARDFVGVADALAVLSVIREAVAHAPARIAGMPVVDVAQRGVHPRAAVRAGRALRYAAARQAAAGGRALRFRFASGTHRGSPCLERA